MDMSSRSQFHIKFQTEAITGQNTLKWLEEESYPTVMLHYHPEGSRDHRKAGNKFGTGQRPAH